MGFKEMKIRVSFSILIEYHNTSGFGGFHLTENGEFIKHALSVDAHTKAKTIAFLFEMSKHEIETKGFLYYIHKEIQTMTEFNHDSSSTIYIAITGISLRVFPVSNVDDRNVLRK
jgi:hypothetical protein